MPDILLSCSMEAQAPDVLLIYQLPHYYQKNFDNP